MPNLSIECFRILKPISGGDGGMDGMGWLSLGGAIYRAPKVLINRLAPGIEEDLVTLKFNLRLLRNLPPV